jgi:hypothetical protein
MRSGASVVGRSEAVAKIPIGFVHPGQDFGNDAIEPRRYLRVQGNMGKYGGKIGVFTQRYTRFLSGIDDSLSQASVSAGQNSR